MWRQIGSMLFSADVSKDAVMYTFGCARQQVLLARTPNRAGAVPLLFAGGVGLQPAALSSLALVRSTMYAEKA